MKNKDRRGFTLIELLVVMTIMAILTMVTVSQFMLAKKRAADSQRKTDLSSVAKALQMYYADYGMYPKADDLKDAEGLNTANINELWGFEMRDLTGYTYMKTMPTESSLKNINYCYKVSDDQKMFSLYTVLENTNDSECLKDAEGNLLYSGCGLSNAYCFAIASVNADPLDVSLTAE